MLVQINVSIDISTVKKYINKAVYYDVQSNKKYRLSGVF